MTVYLIEFGVMSLLMTALIVGLLIFSKKIRGRFTASCRFIIWLVVIIRLAIPMGGMFVPAIIDIDVPVGVEDTKPVQLDSFEGGGSVSGELFLPDSGGVENGTINEDTEETSSGSTGSFGNVQSGNSTVTPSVPEDDMANKKALKLDKTMISALITAVWAFGAVVFFTVNIIRYNVFAKSVKRTLSLADGSVLEVYGALIGEMGIKKAPDIYVSKVCRSPMLFGYFKKRIVVPELSVSDDALRSVLTHELIHYRRGDVWLKLLALIANSIHWFNPLVYVAVSRFNSEMELSCDEKALAGVDEEARVVYGKTMLDIVSRCRGGEAVLTTKFNPRKNASGERIRNILDTKKKRKGIVLIAVSIVLCITVGILFGCADKDAGTKKNEDNTKEDTTKKEENNDTQITDDGFDLLLIEREGYKLLGKSDTDLGKEGELKLSADGEEIELFGTYPYDKEAGYLERFDVNGDEIEDYILVITTGIGTGVSTREMHVFDGSALLAVEYEDPYEYFKENAKLSSDKDNYYVEIGGERAVFSRDGIEAASLTEPFISPVNVSYDTYGGSVTCTYSISLSEMNTVFLAGLYCSFSCDGAGKMVIEDAKCINNGDAFRKVSTNSENWAVRFSWSDIILEGRGKSYVYSDYRGDEPEMADYNIGMAYTIYNSPSVLITADEKYAAIRFDRPRLTIDDMSMQVVVIVELETGKVINHVPHVGDFLKERLESHGMKTEDIEAYSAAVNGIATRYGVYSSVSLLGNGGFRIDEVFKTDDNRIQLKGYYEYSLKNNIFSGYKAESTIVGDPLVLSVNVYNIDMLSSVYDNIKEAAVAFLKKDTKRLEELTGCGEGVLESYKGFKFGDHSIKPYQGTGITITVDIEKSPLDTVKEGKKVIHITQGVNGVNIQNLSDVSSVSKNSEGAQIVRRWLNACTDWYIDTKAENFEMEAIHFLYATIGANTSDVYRGYAKRFFGVENLKIPESFIDGEGNVTIGRGGSVRYYTISSVSDYSDNNTYTVTVQFYADSMMTVKSHTVEYTFKNMGDYHRFTGYRIAEKGKFEPGGFFM
ncbi:MAG: M56 family metallopeptidase [Clostridia bacterium]|nr:M56 family metallopeptidase [Clostridia bacterium]